MPHTGFFQFADRWTKYSATVPPRNEYVDPRPCGTSGTVQLRAINPKREGEYEQTWANSYQGGLLDVTFCPVNDPLQSVYWTLDKLDKDGVRIV